MNTAHKTLVTTAHALDKWDTAVFYNNELGYMCNGYDRKDFEKQIESMLYNCSVLADYCNDIRCRSEKGNNIIKATKSRCLNLIRDYSKKK
jgi:hypothetical protein